MEKIYKYVISCRDKVYSEMIISWEILSKGKEKYVVKQDMGINKTKHIPISGIGEIYSSDQSASVVSLEREGLEEYRESMVKEIVKNNKNLIAFQESKIKLVLDAQFRIVHEHPNPFLKEY